MSKLNDSDIEFMVREISKKVADAIEPALGELDGCVENDGGGDYIYIDAKGSSDVQERDNGAGEVVEDYRCLSVYDEEWGTNPEKWKWNFWNHACNVYENSELTLNASVEEVMEFLKKCMKIEEEAFKAIAESAKK